MAESSPLPADVLDALGHGNPIEAIKRLRAATGLGLKDAKDVIDAYEAGAPVRLPPRPSETPLPADVRAALQAGNKIEAIRLLRDHTGLGLKEAKDAVEAAGVRHTAQVTGAPGEMPRSGNSGWLLLAIAVAVVVAYFLLKG